MKIHAYTMAHNEELMLPYWIRHYSTFCDWLFVYDNESTDRTAEIASKADKCTLIPVESGGFMRESVLTGFKNTAYHQSRGVADWVVMADTDEFLWNKDVRNELEMISLLGYPTPKVYGYNMVSDKPPQSRGQIYDEIKFGVSNDEYYGKRCVFHPVMDMHFEPGCHACNPIGPCKTSISDDWDLKLLHYAYLGETYFVDKYLYRDKRVSLEDRERWKDEYLYTSRQLRAAYRRETSKPIVQVVP